MSNCGGDKSQVPASSREVLWKSIIPRTIVLMRQKALPESSAQLHLDRWRRGSVAYWIRRDEWRAGIYPPYAAFEEKSALRLLRKKCNVVALRRDTLREIAGLTLLQTLHFNVCIICPGLKNHIQWIYSRIILFLITITIKKRKYLLVQ